MTAGFGDGHHAAARNLEEALRREPGVAVGVRDLFEEAAPRVDRLLRFAYRMTITFAPRVWRGLYDLAATEGFGALSGPLLAPVRRRLECHLEESRPDAVISTYPAYPPLVEAWGAAPGGRRRAGAPFSAVVVTDAITVHPVWLLGRADRFYVADETTAGILADRFGVDPAAVASLGFPVSPAMPERLAQRTRVASGDELRILFFPTRSRRDVAREIGVLRRALGSRVRLTILLGRHARRLGAAVDRALRDWPGPHRPEVREWVPDAWSLMPEHDLVIAKAGGATVHEAIAARCPMLIDKIVPGQEEGNARLVATLPCGWVAAAPPEFERVAGRLATPAATAELARFREVLAGVDAAAAATRTARDLLAHLATRR